jgi:hypothetical protein
MRKDMTMFVDRSLPTITDREIVESWNRARVELGLDD